MYPLSAPTPAADGLRRRREVLLGIRARLEEEYGVGGIDPVLAQAKRQLAEPVRGLLQVTHTGSTDALDLTRTMKIVEATAKLLRTRYVESLSLARQTRPAAIPVQEVGRYAYSLTNHRMDQALEGGRFPGSVQRENGELRELLPSVRAAVHEASRESIRRAPVVEGCIDDRDLVAAVDGALQRVIGALVSQPHRQPAHSPSGSTITSTAAEGPAALLSQGARPTRAQAGDGKREHKHVASGAEERSGTSFDVSFQKTETNSDVLLLSR
ncbi:hypothetical protein JI739_05495 [Ramlibacter sp. AW1]|uniref:Uncharacterized protein n=1 Tax=Ramlibacter aurantiacus TaxID=2801330 RepID=A0A937D5D5_9BURK|nr:hypothetical protein [Ramlibacter aurantiacus]MBL0419798.1 hypothetical protein [Ramlibacter aurantiacus]